MLDCYGNMEMDLMFFILWSYNAATFTPQINSQYNISTLYIWAAHWLNRTLFAFLLFWIGVDL